MTSTDTDTETRNCLRCGRKLRSAEAVARGYGAGCWSKVRKAEAAADLSTWTPSQLEDAQQLIEDGGVVPTARPAAFRTVSSDGSAVYLTSARFCGCPAGLAGRRCYHGAAVAVIIAASAPAAPAPAPVPDSFWTEMDRLTEAFMAVA